MPVKKKLWSRAGGRKTPAQLDREIAEALVARRRTAALKRGKRGARSSRRNLPPSADRHHATIGRWVHKTIGQRHSVPEDVVRRIYAAVQTAKRQSLYGGHMADLIERSVGRKLIGYEYNVAARAQEHLSYDPPGGYGGPAPKGSAKPPPRAKYDDPTIETASRFVARADTIIKDVLRRRRHPTFGWDTSNDAKDRELLQQAAEELDVAADLYEGAGAGVRGGTLHERAKLARRGDYRALEAYE